MMTRQTTILSLTLASVAIMLAAWGFQFIGGYAPCKMCIWQRYPHVAAILIGALAYAIGQKTLKQGLVWLGALSTSATAAIAIFHSGVERKLWDGPSTCSSGSIEGLNSDELFNQIMNAPLVRCDEIPWQLFGVTMANLNGILSLGLAAGWIWVALKKD